MKYFTIVLFLIILPIFTNGQTIVNIQQATTLWYNTNTSPNTPSAYTWHEETNIKQGVHISVVPPEKTDIYLQQNNSWINFHTWDYGFMFELKVSYDGGSFITYFSDETRQTSGWKNTPFTTLGKHTITLKWKTLSLTTYYRSYDVYVVPQSNKFYKDNYGNTITCWEGNGEKKPIIVSEGFDAYDVSPAEFLRQSGGELFNALLTNGHSIYIVNYIFNSQDIENNASVYHSASEYIGNITRSNDMIAVGVSMGGLIVRYALAKAEGNSVNLPFAKFISIDSPQQGAIMSKPLQDYIKENANTPFKKHGLNNTASRQMLNYNTFGSLKTQFFNELNALNSGTGYPNATENIGVSFSNGMPNTSSGKWLEVVIRGTLAPIPFVDFTIRDKFYLTSEEIVPGSYLPSYLVASSPSPTGTVFGWWTAVGIFPSGFAWINRFENSNPTFIPYNSALDIVNGNSKFDIRIQADTNYFHNQFPEVVVNALLKELVPPQTPTITMSGGIGDSPTLTFSGGGPNVDHYILKKDYVFNSGGNPIHYVNPATSPYTDQNVVIERFGGDVKAIYSAKAVDAYDNESDYSNTVSTRGSSMWKKNGEENKSDEIIDYALESNYPNPFNPTTQISYQLPKNSFVNLVVYNALGQEVAELVNHHQASGKYSVQFNANNLPSGVYIYKLQAGEFSSVKKMLLTK